MSTYNVRLLLKRNGKVSDDLFDADDGDFCGMMPAIGDRIVHMLKGGVEGYRVVDRIFEMGGRADYVTLIVEEESTKDINRLGRFALL